jgi:hypothetical protein
MAFHNLLTPDELRKALVGMHEGLRIRPPGLDEWIVDRAFAHSEAGREVEVRAVNWRCKASAAPSSSGLEIAVNTGRKPDTLQRVKI